MGEPEGRLPSDSISSRSEERCGEVGPVGGRAGGEGGREGGSKWREEEAAHRHIISHTQSVKEDTASVSLIFHNYF